MAVEYHCCQPQFFYHIAIIVLLVVFAGMMSGLTLGLMSLSLVDLEVLAKSGTPNDRKHAAKILPVVQKQHLLLCTLLICNAAAMEALPIFLDTLISAWGAILISVTLLLLFGEIIPQAVCSRYGLAIGAAVAPFVRVLVWICSPVAYPISKLLDYLLGKGRVALFRRSELKTLVTLHGNEAGKGGELTRDETTIIAGALELSDKKARDAMTPISEAFSININAKFNRELMQMILEKGHSRVPVFYEKPTNIIGLVLVKNLLYIHPADEEPVMNVTIRKIPRVPEDKPLYDILNEFQKGHSHMAVVVKHSQAPDGGEKKQDLLENLIAPSRFFSFFFEADVRLEIDGRRGSCRPLTRWKSLPAAAQSSSNRGSTRSKSFRSRDTLSDVLRVNETSFPFPNEEEEAVGIITMEDVIEELLQVMMLFLLRSNLRASRAVCNSQEEIYDETDYQDRP